MKMEIDESCKDRANISQGLLVEIFSREDRSGNHPIQGIVKNILTHSATHPYGIMVELEDGCIGRVYRILSKAENTLRPGSTLPNSSPSPSVFKDPQNNSEKIQQYLSEEGAAYCDDCLSHNLSIYPRQTINQICRKLEHQSIITRQQGICKSCVKNKLINFIGTPQLPLQKIDNIVDLVKKGENEFVEFKASALWSKKYTEGECKTSAPPIVRKFGRDASKVIIAKSLAGFLNTDGGHLLIGIKENKNQNPDEIIGIETEYAQLEEPCSDGYRRMIVDEIIRKYFHPDLYNRFSSYLKITFPKFEGKIVCWIQTRKSDIAVFLTIRGEEYFFIRLDAETRQLEGRQMVEYCSKRF